MTRDTPWHRPLLEMGVDMRALIDAHAATVGVTAARVIVEAPDGTIIGEIMFVPPLIVTDDTPVTELRVPAFAELPAIRLRVTEDVAAQLRAAKPGDVD